MWICELVNYIEKNILINKQSNVIILISRNQENISINISLIFLLFSLFSVGDHFGEWEATSNSPVTNSTCAALLRWPVTLFYKIILYSFFIYFAQKTSFESIKEINTN